MFQIPREADQGPCVLLGESIRQGAVARGNGVDFGSVHAPRVKACELAVPRHLQYVREDPSELRAEAPPGTRQGVMVGALVAGDEVLTGAAEGPITDIA